MRNTFRPVALVAIALSMAACGRQPAAPADEATAPAAKPRLQANLSKPAEFTRLLNRSWTRFTTGH